jgi:hypothetical protein
MIVRDKEKSIEQANYIADMIMDNLNESLLDFDQDGDDPAEHIYLVVHIIGNLIFKICFTLEGYGQVYGIKKMDKEMIKKWINTITEEYFKTTI